MAKKNGVKQNHSFKSMQSKCVCVCSFFKGPNVEREEERKGEKKKPE